MSTLKNEHAAITPAVIGVILIGLFVGVYLVVNWSNLTSEATQNPISLTNQGVSSVNGSLTTSSADLHLIINLPKVGLDQTSPASQNLIPADNDPNNFIWLKIAENLIDLSKTNAIVMPTTPFEYQYKLQDQNPGQKQLFIEFLYPRGERRIETLSFIYQP